MTKPLSRLEILAAIAAVAREHLALERPLEERLRLVEDLELDSLKLLTFAAEIENRFRVLLDAGDEAAIATIGDLVDLLEQKLAGVAPAPVPELPGSAA